MTSSGIIFKDLFINDKDTFIKFFASYYEDNQQTIDLTVTELIASILRVKEKIDSDSSQHFQAAWAKFQVEVLQNQQPLQLMVGYRDQASGHNLQISNIINQVDAESKMLIVTGSQAVQDAVKAAQATRVEEVLQHHLNSFLNTLYRDHLDSSRTSQLIENKKQFLPKNANYSNILNKNWQDIYYNNYYEGQGLGQAYDAFMNHVANYHRQLYDYLSSQGKGLENNLSLIHKTVYHEEGGLSGTFPELLYTSLNHQSWYSGGDIIIVNPTTHAVVYNIQLKTTSIMKDRIPTSFDIRLNKLLTFLNSFRALHNPRQKAEKLYQEFETTVSNSIELQSSLDNTVESLLKILEQSQQKN